MSKVNVLANGLYKVLQAETIVANFLHRMVLIYNRFNYQHIRKVLYINLVSHSEMSASTLTVIKLSDVLR